MRTAVMCVALTTATMISTAGCMLREKEKDTSCDGYGWDVETLDEVVCPGTETCSCPIGEVCCFDEDDGEISDVSCEAAGACEAFSFACDGAEDCAGGQVCCATLDPGGGSSCVEPADCDPSQDYLICRGDGECPDGGVCVASGPGAMFEGVVGFCGN